MTQSVKENDLFGDWFSANWTFYNHISTELARAMTTEEDTVLSAIHAHLTLGLVRGEGEREGEREGGGAGGEGGREGGGGGGGREGRTDRGREGKRKRSYELNHPMR